TSLKGFVSAEIPKRQADCHRLCEERTGCAGFDYSSARNMCRLYAAVQGAQPDPSLGAGSRNRIPNDGDPANRAPPPEREQWHYAR
ncbi:PAN domain-containing protein, partial [Rhizobium ruizarguesonis]